MSARKTCLSSSERSAICFDVGNRIDLARNVNDVRIVETSHYVRDRVAFADIGEELVPQPLALRRSRHQSRDVDELDRRRGDFLRRRR